MLNLPVSDIVTVDVTAGAAPISAASFNQGLIVGPSTVITPTQRLQQYASTAAMLQAGFTDTDPEYLAAELYFGQPSVPQYVWIGVQVLTALGIIAVDAGGTGYVVGDVVTVVQTGASGGQLTVTTVASGVVTGLALIPGEQGSGYSIGTGLATTGGTGTGLTVNISAIGESFLQAVEACALANSTWYGVMCCGAVDADHIALGTWSTANWQTSLYFGSSPDSGIPAATPNNTALQMMATKDRALLTYDTTQSGLYPNNIYAAAAVLGNYCGLNTGNAGSAFTLNLKSLPGVAPEPLSQTQYTNITAANCNTCASFGPYDGYFISGVLSSGEFFDQILYRAMLVNLLQTELMNLLVSVPKIPQTNPGEQLLIAQAQSACAQMASIGYLGPGTWDGPTVTFANGQIAIASGQSLPSGYLVVAPPYSIQSAADKQARKAMPIYCFINEAGAVHSIVVQVNVQL